MWRPPLEANIGDFHEVTGNTLQLCTFSNNQRSGHEHGYNSDR